MAAVVVAVVVILAACAAHSDEPGRTDEKTAVHETVRAWTAALADHNGQRACELMAEPAQRQLTTLQRSQDCASAVRRLADALGATGRDQLRHVAVLEVAFPEPGRAIAILGAAGQRLELRKDAGGWMISDLMTTIRSGGGCEYPPPPTSFHPAPPPPHTS